jgi:uncharacterized membrane protein YphA (DoxX/SURF4 family)
LFALVALRIGIGSHFYLEGANKLRDPQPYSAGFFLNAKGHLAPVFRRLVWDPDGVARLDQDESLRMMAQYREQAVQAYGLNEAQAKRAEQIHQTRAAQLQWWLEVNASEIDEYRLALARRDQYQAQPERMQVVSLRGQVAKLERELAGKRAELVAPIDQLWNGYVTDLQELAGAGAPLAITKPGRSTVDSESIDHFIRYFDLLIGGLLILGLFTRLAAVLGAVFLLSVMASQWPGSWGALPIWPQLIESLGLIVLAATGAGRFAGLDFMLSSLRRWCCPPKEGAEEA